MVARCSARKPYNNGYTVPASGLPGHGWQLATKINDYDLLVTIGSSRPKTVEPDHHGNVWSE